MKEYVHKKYYFQFLLQKLQIYNKNLKRQIKKIIFQNPKSNRMHIERNKKQNTKYLKR